VWGCRRISSRHRFDAAVQARDLPRGCVFVRHALCDAAHDLRLGCLERRARGVLVALGDRYGAGEGKLLPEHDEPYITARGLSGAQNGDLAKRLIACVQAAGGASEAIGVPFGTDASAFGMDVPTVVFGPGSIAQAHTDDEWIAVEQLRQATDVLVEFCRQFSG